MFHVLPKYCQPNLFKRFLGILSPNHCLWCQYTRGLGCKLRIDQNGNYYLKAKV